jgi:hypothetical protein
MTFCIFDDTQLSFYRNHVCQWATFHGFCLVLKSSCMINEWSYVNIRSSEGWMKYKLYWLSFRWIKIQFPTFLPFFKLFYNETFTEDLKGFIVKYFKYHKSHLQFVSSQTCIYSNMSLTHFQTLAARKHPSLPSIPYSNNVFPFNTLPLT